MSPLRYDQFLKSLRRLAQEYPEFKHIINPIINQIKQGKEERIRRLLQQRNRSR